MLKRAILTILIFSAFAAAAAAKAKTNVSVLYFENTVKKAEYAWLSKGIADMLISDLSGSDELVLVERESLQKVIDEQHFSMSGFADNTEAVKVGKIFNAQKIITGSFFVNGTTLRIDAKVIDSTTAEVKSVSASGYLKDVLTIEKRLLTALFSILNITDVPDASIDTNSYFAVQNYYQGVDLLDKGQAQLALEKFEKAEEFDPLYDKPQFEKEKAFTFLKNFKKARFHRELSILFREANEIIKHMDQEPFLQYTDILAKSDWAGMSEKEREDFNKKNYLYMLYTSRIHCAWGLQQKLMEIASKRDEMFDDEWDAEEKKLDDVKSDLNDKKRSESKILSDKKRQIYDKYREDKRGLSDISDSSERKIKTDEINARYKADTDAVDGEMESLRNFYDSRLAAAESAVDDFDIRREKAEKDLADKNRILYDKIISIAANAEKTPQDEDQFYQMVLYSRLLALRTVEDYKSLRFYCESFMKSFPENRMIWAVEDMYEDSLESTE